jgi:hypothetical protein
VVYGAALEKRSPVFRSVGSNPTLSAAGVVQGFMQKMERPNFADLFSEDPKMKYGCARNLLDVARKNPTQIYPDLSFFVELLENEGKILKGTAIDIIEALARVDSANKIDKLTGRLFGLLGVGNLIIANHAIAALTDIALAKSDYRVEITSELLRVEHL